MRTLLLLLVLAPLTVFAQPTVTGSQPAANATQVARDADLFVAFDSPLDPASVTPASVRVFGRWSGVSTGTLSLENGNRRLRFSPDRPFMAGESVTLSLSRALTASGQAMDAAWALQFWVASAPSEAAFVVGDWLSIREEGENNIVSYGAYAGDLDGDGDSDLAVPNEIPADVRVFLNDGTGRYGEFTTYALPDGDWPSPSEGADLDNDGKTDIVVGNGRNDRLSVMMGDGAGSFTSLASYPTTGTEVRGVAVLDMDGDGWDDVATANRAAGNVSLFLGNGDGTFAAPTTVEPGGIGETTLAPADANGDGILDLFVGSYDDNQVILLLGDGQGGFTVSDRVQINGSAWMLATGDLDGDGDADAVVASSYANAVETVFSEGDGTLTYGERLDSGSFTIAVDLGDLDGDGALDIVSSNYITGDFVIYRGDGTGGFRESQRVAIEGAGSCAVLHDRDGDGTLDVTGIDEINDRIYFLNRVPTATEPQPDTSARLVRLSANPSRGPVRLALRLPEPAHARVRVFDALGRQLATLFEGVTRSREIVWADEVAAGTYTVVLETEGDTPRLLPVVRW